MGIFLSCAKEWAIRRWMRGGRYAPSRTLRAGITISEASLVRRERHLDVALDVFDRACRRRHDVEIEDFGRQIQRGAGVGNVDDAGDVSLARRSAQDRVGLRTGVAEFFQIFD